MALRYRVVVDTKVLLRGLLNIRSAAGGVVDACDRRAVLLLLSKPVINEYKAVLTAPYVVKRYPELTREKVEIALRRLRYVADVLPRVRTSFAFPRDPRDSKLIELVIEGGATHLISADNDLLSLATGHGDAAKRFRQRAADTRVLTAGELLDEFEAGGGA